MSKAIKYLSIETSDQTYRAVFYSSAEIYCSIILIIVGIITGILYSFIGAAISLLGIWIIVKYFLGQKTIITSILPKKTFKNVIGKRPVNLNENPRNILIIIPQKQYIRNMLTDSFNIVIKTYLFLSIMTSICLYFGDQFSNTLYFSILSVFFVIQLIFAVYYFIREKQLYKNGKEQNILEPILEKLKNNPNNINIQVLLTNHLDKSLEGINHYINNFFDYDKKTLIINISQFIYPQMTYFSKEGIIYSRDIDEFIENTCKSFSSDELCRMENKFYLSNSYPFMLHNYPSVTIAQSSKTQSLDEFVNFIYQLTL